MDLVEKKRAQTAGRCMIGQTHPLPPPSWVQFCPITSPAYMRPKGSGYLGIYRSDWQPDCGVDQPVLETIADFRGRRSLWRSSSP